MLNPGVLYTRKQTLKGMDYFRPAPGGRMPARRLDITLRDFLDSGVSGLSELPTRQSLSRGEIRIMRASDVRDCLASRRTHHPVRGCAERGSEMDRHMKRLAAGMTSLAVVLGLSGSASAAFPDFSRCPRSTPSLNACLDVQTTSGSMTIKGFTVPLGDSLRIKGGIVITGGGTGTTFVPDTGTTGFIAKPVQIPGGILGIDFPIPGNAVTATAELAGPSSSIHLDPSTLSFALPLKLRLTNPIIGPGCQIGTNSSPVRLALITGTTNPPAPNRPISGRIGTLTFPSNYLLYSGNLNVDNSFAVPGASGCGIGLGLINSLINLKLRLPSAAGNNEVRTGSNVAIGGL